MDPLLKMESFQIEASCKKIFDDMTHVYVNVQNDQNKKLKVLTGKN